MAARRRSERAEQGLVMKRLSLLLPAALLSAQFAALFSALCVVPLDAQTARAASAVPKDPLARALDAEDKGERARAAEAYKEVVLQVMADGATDGDRLAVAMLGLERVWFEQGALDSIVPMVRRVLQRRPTDPTAHQIHLRTLVSMRRDDDARSAFQMWRRADANDGAPYREYARLLMQQGRNLAADSLLQEANRTLGAAGAVTGETAQLHVSLGRWDAAARAFREALTDQPWLETAALYGMQRAPVAARDSIRAVLEAPPAQLARRRLLSSLELAWSEPRRAWQVMAALPPDDSTLAAWRAFGERTESGEHWSVAAEAWSAVFAERGDLESQRRAADARLRSGDATSALNVLRSKPPVPSRGTRDTTSERSRRRALLPLEIAALGEAGRVAEAQALLERERAGLDEATRAALTRPLVSAWLRVGEVERARRAMSETDLQDDDEIAGALALYDGDLVTARRRLVRASTQRPELVDALGLLARVRIDRSPAVGRAFLAFAKRDSADAARQFAALADSVGPAAPAVLAISARLGARDAAPGVWNRIVTQYPTSPEAPEALLSWARLQLARGDKDGARVHLERLLVDYTTSALAPQARRELERLKGMVPPSLLQPLALGRPLAPHFARLPG
jgi:tetratricopeptide (TPR) repeat protein